MEVTNLVKDFLLTELPFLNGSTEIDDDTPLGRGGLLDSIGQIRLISLLERSFDIAIDSADVEAGHIQTISSIKNFVLSRVPE